MHKRAKVHAKGRGFMGKVKQGLNKLNTFKPQFVYGDCFAMNPSDPRIFVEAELFNAKYLVVGHPKYQTNAMSDRSTAPEKITLKFTYLVDGAELNKYETKEIVVRYDPDGKSFQAFDLAEMEGLKCHKVEMVFEGENGTTTNICLYQVSLLGEWINEK